MSENTKAEIISIVQTFGAAFIFAVGTEIISGVSIEWTWAFFGSIVLAALRSALKVLLQKYGPTFLGGKKQRVVCRMAQVWNRLRRADSKIRESLKLLRGLTQSYQKTNLSKYSRNNCGGREDDFDKRGTNKRAKGRDDFRDPSDIIESDSDFDFDESDDKDFDDSEEDEFDDESSA